MCAAMLLIFENPFHTKQVLLAVERLGPFTFHARRQKAKKMSARCIGMFVYILILKYN